MPGNTAKRGDLYKVHPSATLEGDTKTTVRPMVCVAEQPSDAMSWKAMSRTTTAFDNALDLHSPVDTTLSLSKEGWWSYRFIRSVKKKWTGHATLCPFVATLPEPLKSQVLDHYKHRPRPTAGA